MPSTRARALCPHAVFLAGDHAHYAEVSGRVMQIFRDTTPLVEPISLDEAFLDVTGARRLHGDGPQIASAIRARIADDEGLTCSVGVASNKFLAKLASEAAKPTASRDGPVAGLGVKVVERGGELAFLRPLPVQALWGVGPKTLEKLRRRGISTVGELGDLRVEDAETLLGRANGHHLHELAHAIDDRPVVPDQRPKSIGHEETFARDHHDLATLQREAVRMADAVAARLRQLHLTGRTVTIKVRFHDFRTITRSITLGEGVDSGPAIARAAKDLLDQIDPSSGVRLLGVSASNLIEESARQLSLDGELAPGWDGASRAVDDIRDRFGDEAIVPATLRGPDALRVKKRGDQLWGPGELRRGKR
jgi:DNA polymerase-4